MPHLDHNTLRRVSTVSQKEAKNTGALPHVAFSAERCRAPKNGCIWGGIQVPIMWHVGTEEVMSCARHLGLWQKGSGQRPSRWEDMKRSPPKGGKGLAMGPIDPEGEDQEEQGPKFDWRGKGIK